MPTTICENNHIGCDVKGEHKICWINNMKNKDKVRAGQAGAAATHRKRYEALVELSKLVNKHDLNRLQSWPTAHLLKLLEGYQKNGKSN